MRISPFYDEVKARAIEMLTHADGFNGLSRDEITSGKEIAGCPIALGWRSASPATRSSAPSLAQSNRATAATCATASGPS